MTHRTTPPVSFSSVRRRELVAEFSAGHITSDAGVLLLRAADRRIGLTAALDAAIADPRSPERIVHPQRTLLAQRVLGLDQPKISTLCSGRTDGYSIDRLFKFLISSGKMSKSVCGRWRTAKLKLA